MIDPKTFIKLMGLKIEMKLYLLKQNKHKCI